MLIEFDHTADVSAVPHVGDGVVDPLHRTAPRGLRPNRRTPRAAVARARAIAILVRRRDAGYQTISLARVGMRGDVIACGRQYFRMPAAPPSRVPTPDSFQPPIGRSKAKMLD